MNDLVLFWNALCRATLARSVLATIATGIALTTLICWQTAAQNQRMRQDAVDRTTDRIANALVHQMERYQYGLRGARGAVISPGVDAVTLAQFRRYTRSRDLDREFPGSRGFGFIRRVAQADEARYLAHVRKDLGTDFSISQWSVHDGDRYVVEFIEPVSGNGAAIGRDIASEPTRRLAAESAMRSGSAVLTGPITLIQASGEPSQAFLFMLPVYADGAAPPSEQERVRDTVGWTYSPLKIQDVLNAAALEQGNGELRLDDIGTTGTPVEFYRSGSTDNALPPVRHGSERDVFGRRWRVTFAASPAFFLPLNLPSVPNLALIGMLATLICAALMAVRAQSRERYGQLLRMRSEISAIVEQSTDAIVGVTLDGAVTSWNRGAATMFGLSAREALGRTLHEMIVPPALREQEAALMHEIASGKVPAPYTTRLIRQRGEEVHVSVAMAPILDSEGNIVGASRTMRDITQQKQAEAALSDWNSQLETEVRQRTHELDGARRALQTVLDAVPSMIGYWDKNLVNRVANHTYGKWFGIDPATLPGKPLRELLPPDLYEANLPRVEAALRGEPQTFERSYRSKSGDGKYLLVHYIPDRVNGEVAGFYAIGHDITELTEGRMQLAAALRKNEALLHTINDQLLYSETDLQGNIVDLNDNFCRTHGFTREQLLGGNHRVLSSGVVRRETWQDFWTTLKSGRAWRGEICNRTADGSLVWFDTVVAAIADENGAPARYIALRINITERKLAAQEVGRLNSVLHDVLRSASEVSIIATDPEGLITVFNSGAERMLGYAAAEVVGLTTPARFHDAEEVLSSARQQAREVGISVSGFETFTYRARHGGADTREWTYLRKDGARILVSLSVTAMRDGNGVVTGYLGVATDISARKASEAKLLEAKRLAEQANVAKSQFLANMSHEIRTPLNAVLGMLALLGKSRLDATQSDQVGKAHTAARSLLGLLNDILDYSKIEAGKMLPDVHSFDLDDAMRELGVILSANLGGKNVELLFELDPALPRRAVGDRQRIQQILINLSGNALKFTASGQVVVKVEQLARDGKRVTIRFTVIDSGIGISAEQMARIFDGFSQAEASTSRRFGGTGLGLAISKRLAQMMGGDLELASVVGQGSRFWFDLTLNADGDESLLDALPAPLPSNLRALVADDNACAGSLTAAMLQTLGLQADYESGGRQAIERFMASTIDGRPYDLILLDRCMPDCGGASAARQILQLPKLGKSPALILMTLEHREAQTREEFEEEALFAASLGKPATLSQLYEALAKALGLRAPEVPNAARPETRTSRLQGLRLLVVEDNALNRQVASGLLASEGAEVTLAEGGVEGVAKAVAADADFDVILMDVQMPDIDGLEATRRIRADARKAKTPILALTANASSEEREHCLTAGMDDHVGKPIDMAELVPALLRLAARAEVSGERAQRRGAEQPALLEPFDAVMRRLGGNKALFGIVMTAFDQEYKTQFSMLNQAREAGDKARFAAVLHTIKSTAATVGAKALAERAARDEKAILAEIKAGIPSDIESRYRELYALAEESLAALLARDGAGVK